ncbi:hypothetical protein J7F03_12685 [Streptomyces sp. ISL-43]|uniref:hypothetical protein n=1 Tax=Streptomyces sp. ISL-43 TaxID=2819183 RepID=UPI001BE94824|nr:hypothetical protein [Streptomyces sp. ISL-43]MBT2447918.1 hypothetical protein [Streptomyces sp. ISL-43]
MNVAQDLFRFAELAARTGLEPKLGQRFDRDPSGVLLEFGLEAHAVDWAAGATVSIDDLSAAVDGAMSLCTRCDTCTIGALVDAQVAA